MQKTYQNTLKKIYSPTSLGKSSRQRLAEVPDEFTGCIDLLMNRFIKITVTGDLSHLGNCSNPEELWERIHSEYTELSGDVSNSRGLELAKQITFLTNKINITNEIVAYLDARGRVDELVQELKNMGYRLTFTDLPADLKRVLSLSKTDHVKLKDAQSQYEALETGEKTTEFQWYQMLAALAKHRGVQVINPALITVMEYIAMEKEFKDYVQAMKAVNK